VVMVHAFLALLAGYAAIVLFDLGLKALSSRVAPSLARASEQPAIAEIIVQLGGSFVAGALGGFLTAYLARGNSLIHVLVLALVILLMAALGSMQERGKRPVWFLLAQVALAPLGVMAGGMLQLRIAGIL
jgi:MFS-type transporter involved in bile tolerance (Atg22 family)